jgi:hypothetical protein
LRCTPVRQVGHPDLHRGGHLARRGICNLKSQGAFARMPYWLSLFGACQHGAARPGAAEAILDAALADGHAHNDVWWQPE